MAERQSARMSKITHDGLTRSGTGCFIAVSICQQWASKGYCDRSSCSRPREWLHTYTFRTEQRNNSWAVLD